MCLKYEKRTANIQYLMLRLMVQKIWYAILNFNETKIVNYFNIW